MSEIDEVLVFRVTPDLRMYGQRSVLVGWTLRLPVEASWHRLHYGKKIPAVKAARNAAKRLWEEQGRPSVVLVSDRNGEPMSEHRYGSTAPGGSRES